MSRRVPFLRPVDTMKSTIALFLREPGFLNKPNFNQFTQNSRVDVPSADGMVREVGLKPIKVQVYFHVLGLNGSQE